MILIDESDGRTRALAFLFPQDVSGQGRLDDFLTSIDEIERRTGIDFLRDLPDGAENALEASKASRVW